MHTHSTKSMYTALSVSLWHILCSMYQMKKKKVFEQFGCVTNAYQKKLQKVQQCIDAGGLTQCTIRTFELNPKLNEKPVQTFQPTKIQKKKNSFFFLFKLRLGVKGFLGILSNLQDCFLHYPCVIFGLHKKKDTLPNISHL